MWAASCMSSGKERAQLLAGDPVSPSMLIDHGAVTGVVEYAPWPPVPLDRSALPNCKGCVTGMWAPSECLDRHQVERRKGVRKGTARCEAHLSTNVRVGWLLNGNVCACSPGVRYTGIAP